MIARSQGYLPLVDAVRHGEVSISVVGLGYVGINLAIAFSNITSIIGFDVSTEKIEAYRSGHDPTEEVGDHAICSADILYTLDETDLRQAYFHIVAVPTPINEDKTPDLAPLISASKAIGRNLLPGSVVVYESTVYPGATEEVCIPLLEAYSGLVAGRDFKVGYSPERVNPGDKVNRIVNIAKIVSGMDAETLDTVAGIYALILSERVYKASSIKVAEAAKVVENSQRDINIAFMNEMSKVFAAMDIDTNAVVDAMNTKWNALGFRPGLVGGHCIGIDPYYMIHKAHQLGIETPLLSTGREVNDGMAKYVAQATVRQLLLAHKNPQNARVALLGATFKENCNDVRNSKAIDIYRELIANGITPILYDPCADEAALSAQYGITLSARDALQTLDCVIIAVGHDVFRALSEEELLALYAKDGAHILIDVKGVLRQRNLRELFLYWTL